MNNQKQIIKVNWSVDPAETILIHRGYYNFKLQHFNALTMEDSAIMGNILGSLGISEFELSDEQMISFIYQNWFFN